MISGQFIDRRYLPSTAALTAFTSGALLCLPHLPQRATVQLRRGRKAHESYGSSSGPPGPIRGPGLASGAPTDHPGASPPAASPVLAVAGPAAASVRSSRVAGTQLRTIDYVIAASSVAPAAAAAPQEHLRGPCSSVSSMEGEGGSAAGGVRLLVVVGVVLLDDPEWSEGATASLPGPTTGMPEEASMSGQAFWAVAPKPRSSGSRPVRVLLAQRPLGKANAGLWEFPGGKVDPGETPEAALVRELREELNIAVDPADLWPLTFASHTYPAFHLLMPVYACWRWRGEPHGAEGQAVVWAAAEEMLSYSLTPADVPLVPAVLAAMRYTKRD